MLQVPGWTLGLRGEVLGRDALPALLPDWEDLCARSVEDNVYYTPRYACALLDNVERNTDVRFAVVWRAGRLMALLPFTSPKLAVAPLQPAARAWHSDYTYTCTPLLDRVQAMDAAAALLNVLTSLREGEWIIPRANTQGAACRAIIAALERSGRPWLFAGHFQRASLQPSGTFDEHMQRHVSAKRRKDIARNRRRLDALGKVAHAHYRSGHGLDAALSAFLEIEASGWKGKRGTALACSEQTRDFALQAFTGDAATSICRADVLTLDGKPIAVGLITFAGRTGFTVKCTYDETYRSYCAGLLLEIEVMRSVLSEKWADRLDGGTDGTHVIDGLWSGRVEVADLMFSTASRCPELRLSVCRRVDQMGRNAKSGTKQALAWLARRADLLRAFARKSAARMEHPL